MVVRDYRTDVFFSAQWLLALLDETLGYAVSLFRFESRGTLQDFIGPHYWHWHKMSLNNLDLLIKPKLGLSG